MTEKRFTIKQIINFLYGKKVTDVIMDDGIELPQSTVCDLLNELTDVNEQLQKKNDNLVDMIARVQCRADLIKEENEKLKKREELFYRERNIKNEWRTLKKENEQLKKLLECSREEANDYCEELMGKDELIRLYKRHIDEVIEENKQLQTKNDIDRNCYNCKHCSTYDEGPGYGFVSLCEKDCMNTDGYFDYEYHKFKSLAICPFWEYGDDL